MSPKALAALKTIDASRYPDSSCTTLRAAIAERLNVAQANVLFGNGSIELIWLLASAYLRPGDNVVVFSPTFGEYARAAAIHGARVIEHRAEEADSFRLDLKRAKALLLDHSPRLVFLCNPNNPTGAYLDPSAVTELSTYCHDGLLVVDEAYLAFVDAAHLGNPGFGDGTIVRLRSMTKDYALAGLRLGYVLAQPDIIQALDRVRPPWSVNSVAQTAGLAALEDEHHIDRARELVAESKAFLVDQLGRRGLPLQPSAANYILVRVGDGRAFRSALLKRGRGVRDCASFGLPEFIRIGIRSLEECRQLVAAIDDIL
jgi:histidinol-phosphate aminotransferase